MEKSKAYKYQLSDNHFSEKYQEYLSTCDYTFCLKDGVYYLAQYNGADLEEIGSLGKVEYMLDCEIDEVYKY